MNTDSVSDGLVIAFLSNKLTLRGSEVALYDYADYNEKILGNKSIIITRDYNLIKKEFDVDKRAYTKFTERFPVFNYSNNEDIDRIVCNERVTHLYINKSGEWDGIISSKCKNLIHCIFSTTFPHGEVYSVIGNTINNIYKTNFPIVPHMVILPDVSEDLRSMLNIPKDAVVFGRYGGVESFDIDFVHRTIQSVLEKRDDIYFIFMNTLKFLDHNRVFYLEGTTSLKYKRMFVNTCDALIHARARGETFGLTCGEFAICKKPVITYGGSIENEHILILKDKAVIYNNSDELKNILLTFIRGKYDMTDNGYMFYTPKKVMEIFRKVFLT